VTTISNKTSSWLGGLLLSFSVAAGTFISEPVLFFIPLLLLLFSCFLQAPHLLFYTLLFSIPWSVEMNVTESLGTDFPDEPLMVLMAFAVVALLIVQRNKTIVKTQIHLLLWILLLTVAWSAVTVIASTHTLLSLKFFLARSWYLLAFVGAPLVLRGDEKFVRRSAMVLFGSMFLVTCIGLYRHALMGFTFATINEAIAPFFRNHVNYSALLVFMVPLQVAFYTLALKRKSRVLLLLSIFIVLAALYLSFARGAWLALLAGLLSYGLLKKRWLFQAFIVFVLAIASFVFWLAQNDRYLSFAPKHDITIFHEDFAEHLVATYKGNDVSTAERFYRWVAGVRMSGERWATGFGPTTFYQHYKSYAVPAFRTWVSDNREQSTVHNYFLLLLIEQGVVGLLLFLLLLGTLFWYAQKIYHRTDSRFWKTTVAAIAAILAMQCILNCLSDLIETDKVGSVFYLCLSFLIIADVKTKRTDEQTNKEQGMLK
jgi:O-antigen ligase